MCCQGLENVCQRPWVSFEGIHSFSARYFVFGSGGRVLRRWKTSKGTLFDQRVLRIDSSLLSLWKAFAPQLIIPVPQSFRRAWKLRGSPAERISNWVSSVTHVQSLSVLLTPSEALDFSPTKRQAELNLIERLENPIRFIKDPLIDVKGVRRVILVDDFMTTGRTLRTAAQALQKAGVEEVHVFCLGLRAFKLNERAQSDIIGYSYG